MTGMPAAGSASGSSNSGATGMTPTGIPCVPFCVTRGGRHLRHLWLINAFAAEVPAGVVNRLAALPAVARVELDRTLVRPPAPVPSAIPSRLAVQADHIGLLRADDVWAQGYDGTGVVVAIVDSGVDINHPDLAASYRGGSNSWYNAVAVAGAGSTLCDAETVTPCDEYDTFGTAHGTAVAGLVVGDGAGGQATGVAPGVQWIAAKVFDADGLTTNSIVIDALQWLVNPDGNPATDDAPDIVNGSWGYDLNTGECLGSSLVGALPQTIANLRGLGMLPVFSAGNNGPDANTDVSPANYPETLSVGSVNPNTLGITTFSARGPSACDGAIFPDLVVPGKNLVTADLGNGYVLATGTSFAAPLVSGVAALLLQADPLNDPNGLTQAMRLSANDLGPAGADNSYGYGLVDAFAALNEVTVTVPVAQVLDPVAPEDDLNLAFGSVGVGDSVRQTVRLRNRGGQQLQAISFDVSGLAADFSLDRDTCTGAALSYGQSCTFDLVFAPSGTGVQATGLQLLSNDGSNPSLPLSLSGNGLASAPPPDLTASLPAAELFEQVSPGSSVVGAVNIENTGAGPLHLGVLDASGLAAPFSVSGDACSSTDLLAGQNCDILVRFAPDAAGTFSGTLLLASNDAASPLVARFNGIANNPPPAPVLSFPADGAADLVAPVTFRWTQDPDVDGHALSYRLLIDTDPFFNSPIVRTASLEPTWPIMTLAVLLPLGWLRRRNLLLLTLGGAVLLLVSCGGGGGGGTAFVGAGQLAITVNSLDPATTYYWKVETTDSLGGTSVSGVRFFTTR